MFYRNVRPLVNTTFHNAAGDYEFVIGSIVNVGFQTESEYISGVGSLYSEVDLKKGASILVAAVDANEKVKAGADYVCDGTADQVEIQAALDMYGVVTLSQGTFNISEAIQLKPTYFLGGSGINITNLQLTGDCNLIEYDCLTDYRVFSFIRDMRIHGDLYSYPNAYGIKFKTASMDFHLQSVFIDKFKVGLHMQGSWGAVIDDVIVEYCSSTGIHLGNVNGYVFTGTTSGTFAYDEEVTQATSGAKGRVVKASSTSMMLEVISGTFNSSNDIDSDVTSSSFSPTFMSGSTTIGPKINNCKIQQNEGDSLYIDDDVYNTLISTSEFDADENFSGIHNTGKGTVINGNRFSGQNASSKALIYFDDCIRSTIVGNYFNTASGAPAVVIDSDSTTANLITGNTCILYDTTSDWVLQNGSRKSTNVINNNNVINAWAGSYNYATERNHWLAGALTYYGNQKLDNKSGWDDGEVCMLPAGKIGMQYEFYNVRTSSTKEMRIKPYTGEALEISVGGGLQPVNNYLSMPLLGNYVKLLCTKDGEWRCLASVGTLGTGS